jgi:integrase/recombinase XerD
MPTQDFEELVNDTKERIRESEEILPENKELLEEYHRDRTLEGLSDATLERDLSKLKVLAEQADKPFDEMDKDDVKTLVAWVHREYDNDSTQDTHKKAIRNLFKILNDGEHPEKSEWIQLSNNGGSNKLPSDLLTKEDVEAQIEACKNPRDKALVAILWETGARYRRTDRRYCGRHRGP